MEQIQPTLREEFSLFLFAHFLGTLSTGYIIIPVGGDKGLS